MSSKPAPKSQSQVNQRRDALVALCLTAFCVLVYGEIYFWQAFGPEFPLYYFWGDGGTWQSVLNSYLDFKQGWYRPTGALPYWPIQKLVDWHDLAAWRLVNVLTCAITGWLVYILSLELFPARRTSAVIAALYFLVHPAFYIANFEVATFDFLHLIFALLTVLFYIRSLRRPVLAVVSWLCFFIAVTAKEVNIALPGVLFVASALHVWQKPAAERWRAARLEALRLTPFLLILPAYWYLHIRNMPKPGASSPYHWDFNPLRTVTMFGNLLLWGARLFFVVKVPEPDVIPANWLDHLLGLASVGVVIWQWRKLLADKPELRPRLLLLLGWYVCMLLIPAATAGFMRHTSLSVPAYSIIFGVAFAQLLRRVPEQRRRLVNYGSLAFVFLFTMWGIHTELHAGTHANAIRISETLLAKPPVPPESLGPSATIFIEDRLNLGPWSYGCFGRLFAFVYKRKDLTEVIFKPGDPYPQEAVLANKNAYIFRYNDRFEWYDGTEQVRAAVLKPGFVEMETGQSVQFQTKLRDYAKLKWKVVPVGFGTVSPQGIYTAPAQIEAPRSARVSASTDEQTPQTVSATVNVFQKWQDAAIGNPSSPGKHSLAGSTHIVEGAGDLWATADQFHFTYQKVSGDGTWIAQVMPMAPATVPVKMGIMIRASLLPDSPNLFAGIFSGRQAMVSSRQSAGGNTIADFGPFAYTFFRVERHGNELKGATSPDGQHWQDLGTPVTLPLGTQIYAGLAVSSGNGPAVSAEFTGVRWEAVFPHP